jgi:hypothetical protein
MGTKPLEHSASDPYNRFTGNINKVTVDLR